MMLKQLCMGSSVISEYFPSFVLLTSSMRMTTAEMTFCLQMAKHRNVGTGVHTRCRCRSGPPSWACGSIVFGMTIEARGFIFINMHLEHHRNNN